MIARNPADAVEPPRVQQREVHTMNEDDVSLFLQAAQSTSYYPLFYLALFTGRNEALWIAGT